MPEVMGLLEAEGVEFPVLVGLSRVMELPATMWLGGKKLPAASLWLLLPVP